LILTKPRYLVFYLGRSGWRDFRRRQSDRDEQGVDERVLVSLEAEREGRGQSPCWQEHDSRATGTGADGLPGMVIFKTCTNLIRTLPSLPYSTTNPEDVADNTEDHAYETLRIALQERKLVSRIVRCGGL
jgi:hypothetical protein